MKVNIKQIANLSAWTFSLLISVSAFAQSVTKTFVIAENIASGSTISTKDAFDICINSNGYIRAITTKDQKYQIWASDANKPILEIDRDVIIETTDKNVFTQKITVTIDADIPGEAQKMMDALKGMAFKTNQGSYGFDALMGIETLKITNGFWKVDREVFEMKNRQVFYVKSVKFKTVLEVPQNANLVLDAEYTNFDLGTLDGNVELMMKGCQLNAESINNLAGRATFSQIAIQNMDNGEVQAKKTNFNIGNANQFEIGLSKLAQKNLLEQRRKANLSCALLQRVNSDLNKYTFNKISLLEVNYSSSDYFKIGTIDNLEVDDAVFSNFKIENLQNRLWANCKNGDIEVATVSKNVEQIEINNEVSEVAFGVTQLPAYFINLENNERMEVLLPTKAVLQATDSTNDKTYQKGTDPYAPKISIKCDQCKVKIKD